MDTTTAFSLGYNHGNYGNAYESNNWRTWIAEQTPPDNVDAASWLTGVHFGYWGSYEGHEIPNDVRDAVLAVLNDSDNRQLCDAAGCVNRD